MIAAAPEYPPARASARLHALAAARSGAHLAVVADAWSARLAAARGLAGLQLSLDLLAALRCGEARGSLIGGAELADALAAVVAATELPVVVELADGFGNALHVDRIVRLADRLGAAGVELADLATPGTGRTHVAAEEFAGKLRAARDAAGELVVVARVTCATLAGPDAARAAADAALAAGAHLLRFEAADAVAYEALCNAYDAHATLVDGRCGDRGAAAGRPAAEAATGRGYAWRVDVGAALAALERGTLAYLDSVPSSGDVRAREGG